MPASAVVDSSVLISGFLGRAGNGTISQLLRYVRDKHYTLCVSRTILDETTRSLLNPRRATLRNRATIAELEEFLSVTLANATLIEDLPSLIAVPRDPNDDHVIACAVKAGAGYVITGDKDMLSLESYGGIRIVTPRQFLDVLTTA